MIRTKKCAKKSTKLPSNLFEGNISVMGFQCMEYNTSAGLVQKALVC